MQAKWKIQISLLAFTCITGGLFITSMNILTNNMRREFNDNINTLESALSDVGCETIVLARIESPSLIINVDTLTEFVSVAGEVGAREAYYQKSRVSSFRRSYYIFAENYAIAYVFSVTTKLEE